MNVPRNPRKRRNEPLRLLQFTDPHISGDEHGTVRGIDTLATFRACLADAQRHHWPVEAILLTGDLVQDNSRGYLRLAGACSMLRTPVHCVPGNHDLTADMDSLLHRRPFVLEPVVRHGDWTLLLLDSSVPGAVHGELSRDSLRFLDETLGRYADSHALVVLHHHPVRTDSRWLDESMLADAEALLAVLDRHDNVRGMLWGHVHQALDGMRNGVALMSTPSTCFQFMPHSERFTLDDRPPGYRWLHLYPDGRIDTRVVWIDAAGGGVS